MEDLTTNRKKNTPSSMAGSRKAVATLDAEDSLRQVNTASFEEEEENEEVEVVVRPKVPQLLDKAATKTFEARQVSNARKMDPNELAALWKKYKKTPTNKVAREQLILHYLHLVRYVVSRMPISLPSSISVEDLISYGTLGLMESVERFDIERGLKFETYAVTRIRGSIIDQLRVQDWVPRGVRKRSKAVQEAFIQLEETLGRAPNDDELATHLQVPKAKVQQMLAESRNLLLSLDDSLGNDGDGSSLSLMDTITDANSPDPQGELEADELRNRLAEAIGSLPEREKLLIALYYHETMTLKEIGEVINVSESRVCQLHAQAITRLRNKLR